MLQQRAAYDEPHIYNHLPRELVKSRPEGTTLTLYHIIAVAISQHLPTRHFILVLSDRPPLLLFTTGPNRR